MTGDPFLALQMVGPPCYPVKNMQKYINKVEWHILRRDNTMLKHYTKVERAVLRWDRARPTGVLGILATLHLFRSLSKSMVF